MVKLTISTSDHDGQMKGDIHIQTPLENVSLPVSYKVAAGEMIIDRDDLVFDNCFPVSIIIGLVVQMNNLSDPDWFSLKVFKHYY